MDGTDSRSKASKVSEDVDDLDNVENLNLFVEMAENKLQSLLQSFGWSKEYIDKNNLRVKCPYDNSHLTSASKIESHIEKCKLGVNRLDEPFPENVYKANSSTVVIDPKLSAQIISQASSTDTNFKKGVSDNIADDRSAPFSFNQMVTTFTTDERRALYDYVISKAERKEHITDHSFLLQSNNEHESKHQQTALEELAMIRDMKRRRAKYKVSTKAKSYTEVMRGVIDNLMASFAEDLDAIKTENNYKNKRKWESSDGTSYTKDTEHSRHKHNKKRKD